MDPVKKARRYDSSRRAAQALRNRNAILDAAERQFLEGGHAATTVSSIAQEAGVSVETVYKAFGGKAELVGAIYDRGLIGRQQSSVYERSDAMREHEQDPEKILRSWAAFIAELGPDVSPIRLVMRSAAEADPDLAKVLDTSDRERLQRMQHNSRFLAKRGYLRAGVTAAEAADFLWMCTSAEFFELLVQRRGWSLRRFERFVGDLLVAALLPSEPNPR
ncbi:MAG TPA: helix-turn-helix domain-containing protein [Gaiellaceae bacterium]|nr:helix-turn-helix domain-containing protein [Gaiellaceae bacterium]